MPSSDESLNEIREHVRTLAQVPYDDVRNEERLRDHFAGQIVAELIVDAAFVKSFYDVSPNKEDPSFVWKSAARTAYDIADAMLAEKRRRG